MEVQLKTKLLNLTFLLIIASVFSCTPKDPSIRIDYELPSASTAFEGKKVSLKVADKREDKNILDPAAFNKFEKFNGKFSFAHKNKDQLLGIYNASGLFKEAIRTRLTKQGLTFVDPAKDVPELLIVLKEFSLKYKNGWKVKIHFEAHLNKDGTLLSKERITQNAEDQISFKSHGERLLEDSFSAIINKLNIERLFAKSKI